MGARRPLSPVVILSALLGAAVPALALGARDVPEAPAAVKGDWVLAMTVLDASSLEPSKRGIADTLTRSLYAYLSRIQRRRRDAAELAAYEASVRYENRSAAGKALADKRAERDALLYKGYPDWKYRAELKKLETAISSLEKGVAEATENPDRVEPLPRFATTEENRNGVFPPAPPAGSERAFCLEKKADGVLLGSVEERYGRIFLRLLVYVASARTVVFEDVIPFSPEDRDRATAEAAELLFAALAGERPSRLSVEAVPGDAVISVGETFGGRGSVGPLTLSPASVSVEAHAEGYRRWSSGVGLGEGEEVLVSLRLEPLARQALELDAREGPAAVYKNGRYVGRTPLALDLHGDAHFSLQSSSGASAAAVVRSDGAGGPGELGSLVFALRPPDGEDYEPVEAARMGFYGAYGRFWIALPAAFLLNGISKTYIDALSYQGDPAVVEDAYRSYFLYLGTSILAGAFFAETIYRLGRYVYTSGARSTPALRPKDKDGR